MNQNTSLILHVPPVLRFNSFDEGHRALVSGDYSKAFWVGSPEFESGKWEIGHIMHKKAIKFIKKNANK